VSRAVEGAAKAAARAAGPPFRADHVGSLLRPPQLLAARAAHREGRLAQAELAALEDAAIREIVRAQEDLGLQAVTDGEFRRGLWHKDFLTGFTHVSGTASPVSINFHNADGTLARAPTALSVTGPLARPRPIFVEHFRFLKSVARGLPKLTIPSPSVLHFRGGRAAVDAVAYPDLAEFFADLARVYREEVSDLAQAGCSYLQLDEVNLAYLCDPQICADARRRGEDPQQLPSIYAGLINGALAGRPREMCVCLHLCRGNFESAWLASGGYEPIAELLFNSLDVDGYFLEYDSERAGDFSPLRFLPRGKRAVLGLVTTKHGALESADDLRRRIEAAARYVPLEQLALSPQCGFASGERGNKLTPEEQFAKLRLVVAVAREVWGSP